MKREIFVVSQKCHLLFDWLWVCDIWTEWSLFSSAWVATKNLHLDHLDHTGTDGFFFNFINHCQNTALRIEILLNLTIFLISWALNSNLTDSLIFSFYLVFRWSILVIPVYFDCGFWFNCQYKCKSEMQIQGSAT